MEQGQARRRRHLVAGRGPGIRAGRSEEIDDFGLAEPGGPMEGGRAIHLGGVHVDALSDQRAHGLHIRLLHGVNQTAISRGRAQAGEAGEQQRRDSEPFRAISHGSQTSSKADDSKADDGANEASFRL